MKFILALMLLTIVACTSEENKVINTSNKILETKNIEEVKVKTSILVFFGFTLIANLAVILGNRFNDTNLSFGFKIIT